MQRLGISVVFWGISGLPIGSRVVPLGEYLIDPKYKPENGTTMEPMGRVYEFDNPKA